MRKLHLDTDIGGFLGHFLTVDLFFRRMVIHCICARTATSSFE